jgi:DNA-directed RNA polymerase specialized sigma24 family protein
MTESTSHLIDRLVLGIPSRAVLTRRMLELVENGWTHPEIARMYQMTTNAVSLRLSRAKRGAP